jgi:hypothetical protein
MKYSSEPLLLTPIVSATQLPTYGECVTLSQLRRIGPKGVAKVLNVKGVLLPYVKRRPTLKERFKIADHLYVQMVRTAKEYGGVRLCWMYWMYPNKNKSHPICSRAGVHNSLVPLLYSF